MKKQDIINRLGNHPFKHMLRLSLYREILDWLLEPKIFKIYYDISKMNKKLPREEQISALEVIDVQFHSKFKHEYNCITGNKQDKCKQFTGYMIKIILELHDLKHIKCIKIEDGLVFNNGSTYC